MTPTPNALIRLPGRSGTGLGEDLEDVRSAGPVERLLEASWTTRTRFLERRELLVEAVAGLMFLACAVPLAVHALGVHHIDVTLALLLVGLYALAAGMIKFPIGAGYVVPSYLVLAPMLLLLPPGVVPLLTAAGLLLGTLGQVAVERADPNRVLASIPDAWHAIGPAAVLLLAGHGAGGFGPPSLYVLAFAAGCVVDLASATVREKAIFGIASHLQLRVIAIVWAVDACVAPLGLLVAHAGSQNRFDVLLVLPLNGLMLLLNNDRSRRIDQAQTRLDLVARERARLQSAVRRLGEALAAKLDLDALIDIVLRGCVEALDADAGRLTLGGPLEPRIAEIDCDADIADALRAAAAHSGASGAACAREQDGVWALAQPFVFPAHPGRARGAVAVVRRDRPFREDEEAVMRDLVVRAQEAAAGIVMHQALREQALTDALTRLGNRRKLAADLDELIPRATMAHPLALVAFDLDGFKSYNDTFGHQAGDALLSRLGVKLAGAVAGYGDAYRLGGDEFCVLIAAPWREIDALVDNANQALEESGETFSVRASHGVVLIPKEAANLDYAMQLADGRMYARKRGRPSSAGDQTREALLQILQARQPELVVQASAVAELCLAVGRRLGMPGEQLDELARAAELHDIGRVGIPDAILQKPGPLNDQEWEFVRQHTVLGERILNAAPSLRPMARIVRATHERWDGQGYPDGLEGEEIPVAARIIAVCDAYGAITSERPYRAARDHAVACKELSRCAGAQFDPAVVDLLLAVLAEGAAHIQGPHAGDDNGDRGNGDRTDVADGGVLKTAAVARLAGYTGSAPVLDAGTRVELAVP